MDYGELVGLLDMLDQHSEAIAYDSLRLGLRWRDLGTDRFEWRELLAVVRQSDPSTALYRDMRPEDWYWTPAALLIAEAVDALRIQVWQLSGAPKRDFPQPIPRPGVTPSAEHYGSDAIPMDDMKAWLGWTS